ncbi:tetratricopeptide repeat protein [Streptomyces sp. WMMC500]|uniref:AfsR/SARP family transcriptional regulator n=1 Tax=Streptomyces sp. WMMC500 TaxID=3015154 RepID=UPI00248A9780|nr:tetratricopeptide repeat protein [Streptomyces sp. WMMC500]WBB62486.1 tetratricopeptide repeat protein [Streptomyces sp. WMMC500]
MRVQVLGPLEVWRDAVRVPLGTPQQRALLGLLVLADGRPLTRGELAEALWGEAQPRSAANLIQTYVKRLRRLLEPDRPARTASALLPRVGEGYALHVPEADADGAGEADGGGDAAGAVDGVDLTRFRRLAARAETARREHGPRRSAALLGQALALWHGPPLADLPLLAGHPALVALAGERRAAVARYGAAMVASGGAAEALPLLVEYAGRHPLDEGAQACLVRAYEAVGQRDLAFAAYLDTRRRLADELGVDPGPELTAAYAGLLREPDGPGGGGRRGRPRATPHGAGEGPQGGAPPSAPLPPRTRNPQPPAPRPAERPAAVAQPVPLWPAPPAPRPVPSQLPADVYGFSGRGGELRALDEPLSAGPGPLPVLVVSGTAGAGKTALAVHWAHRVRGRFPDGQLYVDLRGYDPRSPLPWADALTGFLRALGLGGAHIPLDPEERAARFRTEVTGRRLLLVLDNALSVEQVRPLLPGSPSCAVLVTSRDSMAGLVALHGARRLSLGPLPRHEAVALLRLLVGRRAPADPASYAALAEQCARLPLALRVAAELAATRPGVPLAELVTELADHRRRLDLLDAGGDPRAAVRSVLSWSYRHLPPAAARAFRLVHLHPGPDFGVRATAALLDVPEDDAARLLDALRGAHLVQSPRPGRFAMHDLLRAYAADLARRHDAEESGGAARVRLYDHYLAGATAAMDQLYPAERHHRPPAGRPLPPAPVHGPAEARDWLDAELPVLGAVCAAAAAGPGPEYAVGLAAVLFRHLDGGHHAEGLSFHTHALHAAERTGDVSGEAHALTSLGAVHWRLGEHLPAEEFLERALVLHERSGDLAGLARALSNLGNVHWRLGRLDRAADCHGRALALYAEVGDRVGRARTLTNLGNVCLRRGDLAGAAAHQRRALALHAVTGDRPGRARTLMFLGRVQLRQGHVTAAAGHLRQALDLYRALGHEGREAYALTALGDVYLAQERYEDAADHHRRALRLFATTGERYGEAAALNGLGEALLGAGRPAEALIHHVRAGEVAAATGERPEQVRAHSGAVRARHRAEGTPHTPASAPAAEAASDRS